MDQQLGQQLSEIPFGELLAGNGVAGTICTRQDV